MIDFKLGNKRFIINTRLFSFRPKYYTNNASRYVDEEYICDISWFGLGFTLIKEHFCDLIHIYLDENKKHKYSKNIQKFISILKIVEKNPNKTVWINRPPFIFNYINNKIYISGKREWFLKTNLGSLLQYNYPENYMSEKEMKKFPKYID